jgi:hypothetical protein
MPLLYSNPTENPWQLPLFYQQMLLQRKASGRFVFHGGLVVYLKDGQRHREDGPAVEYATGLQMWYRNGQLG